MNAWLHKRHVEVNGRNTCVSIEDTFWNELREIAKNRGETVSHLVSAIDKEREGNLTSAIRIYVFRHWRYGNDGQKPPNAGLLPKEVVVRDQRR